MEGQEDDIRAHKHFPSAAELARLVALADKRPNAPLQSHLFVEGERRVLPRDTTTKPLFEVEPLELDLVFQLKFIRQILNVEVESVIMVMGATGRVGRKTVSLLSKTVTGSNCLILVLDRLSASTSRAANSIHYQSLRCEQTFPKQVEDVSRYCLSNDITVKVIIALGMDTKDWHALRQFRDGLLRSCVEVEQVVIVTSPGYTNILWKALSIVNPSTRGRQERLMQETAEELARIEALTSSIVIINLDMLLSLPQTSGSSLLFAPFEVCLLIFRYFSSLGGFFYGVSNGCVSKAICWIVCNPVREEDRQAVNQLEAGNLKELQVKFEEHIDENSAADYWWRSSSSFGYIKGATEAIRSDYLPPFESWLYLIDIIRESFLLSMLPESWLTFIVLQLRWLCLLLSQPKTPKRRIDHWTEEDEPVHQDLQ